MPTHAEEPTPIYDQLTKEHAAEAALTDFLARNPPEETTPDA